MDNLTCRELIKAEKVTKRFGNLVAVDNVNFVLYENEMAGIVGSNGAGKTTFFNVLTGYFFPDDGKVFYENQDVTRISPQKRVGMGMMRTFQLTSTFDNLKVVDNMSLSFFRAHRTSSTFRLLTNTLAAFRGEERIWKCLEDFDLASVANREVKHLSLGEKRRLEIAMAVLAEPKVLLLDEPLAGLSESEISGLLGILQSHAHKQTILLVEHKISKVQDI
ncbi:MAG: ATP-binding cassette domain-containing protein [Deltaproteobacteria bacterium]|nr:ATP-binding cassette domain-containing protein [Deltaproteobacteria bacterium]